MTSYIYKITNNQTGKSYVGKHTWKGEGVDIKYWGSGKLIRKIIAKYGLENFSREVLEYVKPEEVFLKESEWIKKENTLIPNGYNLTVESLGGFYQLNEETGEIVFKGHSNWEDLSEDEKVKRLQKMHSAARTPEARQKISEGNRRKYANWSAEKWQNFKENCSKGWSDEARESMKVKVAGSRNGMFGKSYYERWIELYGEEKAKELMSELSSRKSKKSKETNNNPEVRAKFNKTIENKKRCNSYKEWQHTRALCQGLKVRLKRGKIDQQTFDKEFSILKEKETVLGKQLKKELEEIERQN